jgi:hypothetical protein
MLGLARRSPSLFLTHDGQKHGDSAYGSEVSLPADLLLFGPAYWLTKMVAYLLAADRQQRDFKRAEKRQAGAA